MTKLTKISLSTLALLPAGAFAAGTGVGTVPVPSDLSISTVITNVIDWVLALAGGVAVLFLILGGLQYITSSGNKDKAETAKQTILYAVIGLIVIALSYVIVAFVSQNVGKVV